LQDQFTDEYELKEVFKYPLTEEDKKSEITVFGNKEQKVCIFCGQDRQATTFKKEAHIFPASLGNRLFFNNDECDNCNEIIGYLENELSNYLVIERILVGVRKRSGYPKYKPIKGGNTQLKVDTDTTKMTRTINMHIDAVEDRFSMDLDEEKKTVTYSVKNPPPYSPSAICKTIAHSGWSLLNQSDRSKINYLPSWILGNIDLLPIYMDIGFIKGNGLKYAYFEIWESNDEDSSYPFLFRFTFGVRILTLYIPKSLAVKSSPKRFNCYVAIPEDIQIEISGQVIKSNERLIREDIEYTMSYQEIDRIND